MALSFHFVISERSLITLPRIESTRSIYNMSDPEDAKTPEEEVAATPSEEAVAPAEEAVEEASSPAEEETAAPSEEEAAAPVEEAAAAPVEEAAAPAEEAAAEPLLKLDALNPTKLFSGGGGIFGCCGGDRSGDKTEKE